MNARLAFYSLNIVVLALSYFAFAGLGWWISGSSGFWGHLNEARWQLVVASLLVVFLMIPRVDRLTLSRAAKK